MEVLANHIKSSSEDFKANRAHHDALHAEFVERYDKVRAGGSPKAIETQRKRNKLLVRERIDDRIDRGASDDRFAQGDVDFLALEDGALRHALVGPAIVLEDGHGLGHVAELARQIAGVGGLERGVRETLSSAVGRGEVLED